MLTLKTSLSFFQKIIRWLLKSAYHLFVLALAGWCALVLRYAPLLISDWRVEGAAVVGLLYLLFLLRPVVYRIPLFAMILTVYWFWCQIEPTNSGDWQPEVAQLPWVEQYGDQLTFHNVRDFNYRSETDFEVRYVTKKVLLSEFSSVDIFTSYWDGMNIAHVFVSFGFGERDFISVSIEARKTRQQAYSTTDGFFRNFHLTYIVAEERDLVALRTRQRQPHEEVYMVRGRFNREKNTKFLLNYISKINDLRDHPAFYNSLTTNCTTQVLKNAQAGNPLLHYDWRILFSGHTPEYLYRAGALDTSRTLEELLKAGFVNPRTEEVSDAVLFSRNIRQGVPRPPPLAP